MGRQEEASGTPVSEPQQGLASHPARALLPRRLPAKLSQHPRAAGSAGDWGRDKGFSPPPRACMRPPCLGPLPPLVAHNHRPARCLDPRGARPYFPFAETCPVFILLLLRTLGFARLTSVPWRWFPREAEKPEYFSNVTHVGVQDEGLEGTQRHKYAGSDSSDRECQLSLETDHLPH